MIAKRLLVRLIWFSIILQLVIALVDGLPMLPTAFGVVAHLIYMGNMTRFPFVKLTDPLFLLSGGMLPFIFSFPSDIQIDDCEVWLNVS